MRIRPLLWFLGLIGTLAALSIAVGSGRIIHAQVYGSPPLPPTTSVPPIIVSAVNPPPPPGPPAPPQAPTPAPQTPGPTPTATPPTITVGAVNPPPPTATTPTTPPRTTTPVSGLPSTGMLTKMTNLVEQPLFELLVGFGILAALGIFFAWNARTARVLRAASFTATDAGWPAYAPRTGASAAHAAGQPLTPLTARFRSLGALRDRDRG